MKPKSFSNFQRPVLLLSITLAVSHSPQAHATDGTWTNANGGLWSNTANWSGGVVANGASSTANFSSLALSGYHEVSLDSARTIGNLSFGNSEFSSTWLLRNNVNPSNILTLAVSSGSPAIALSYTTQVEISASIAGTAGLTQVGYGAEFFGGTLILSGANTFSGTTYIQAGRMVIEGSGTLGNSSNNLTLAADTLFQRTGGSLFLGGTTQNVGHVEIQGTGDKISGGNLIATHYAIINNGIDVIGNEGQISTISAGLGGAIANLNKSGAGLTILSGTNTYGGSTSIAQGTLQFTRATALYNGDETKWTKENIIVDDSTATLAINVGGAGEFTTQQAKLLLSNLSTGIDNNGIKANANFAIDTSNAAGDITFDQAITDSTGLNSGALSFTKLGIGTLILNQANSHTGTTTVSGGTLAISGAGTLGINANQAALAVNDSGTLNLGGTSQTVGDVTLGGGSITNGNLIARSYTVNGSGSNVSASLGEIGGGTPLYVTGGSVTLSGANTYSGPTIVNGGGITLSGAGTLGSNPSLYITNGGINLGGTTQTVGVVEIQGGGRISDGTLFADSFTLSTASNFSSPNYTANLAGGADLGKYGEGRLTLSGTNSYAGTTTIAEGTLRFNNAGSLYGGNQALWTSDKITVASGGTIELAVGGAGGFTIAQSKTLLTNLSTGVNNNGLQAGSVFGISLNLVGGSNQTFDQVIADSIGVGGGAVSFMNRGSFNTLTLNQANTYTGTTIVGGSLAISGAGTLGNFADLVVGGENLSFGKLDLGGTTQTVDTVTINNGQVLNGNLSGTSYSVQGGIISAGLGGAGASFVKTGATDTTAYLSGANTYDGFTTVNSGTLYLEKTASLYNSDSSKWTKDYISIASGATLGVNVGGAGEFSITQTKSLLTNLTTSLNYSGLQAGSTFEIYTGNATGDLTFDQAITNSSGAGGGALGLTKQGEGKLILDQANTYTGPTTVNGGILAIDGAGTLGNNSALTVGEYGELDLGGTTQNVGAVSIKGAASNGNLVASGYNIAHNGTISAGLGGVGASLSIAADTAVTLSGTNTYAGTTTVSPTGSLQLAKTASLYNGDTSKWTKTNISVNSGTLAVNVGGAGEFSVAQTKALLTNLTSSVNNNGLTNGSVFGIDTSNATGVTTFNQAITDSTGIGGGYINFRKLGGNTLILDQANTYSGNTFVEAGKLVVNGTILASPLITVKSGAALGGIGSVGRVIIESGGLIAPGNSPGILHTGDLTIDGTFAAEINGAAVGSQYDQIDVTGFVTLNGALAVTTGYTPVWGNLFFLIDNDYNDSINGTFTGLAQESEFTMGGQLWKISYNADSGTNQFEGGNDVALMAIPEPNTTILIGLGSLVLLRRRRS